MFDDISKKKNIICPGNFCWVPGQLEQSIRVGVFPNCRLAFPDEHLEIRNINLRTVNRFFFQNAGLNRPNRFLCELVVVPFQCRQEEGLWEQN